MLIIINFEFERKSRYDDSVEIVVQAHHFFELLRQCQFIEIFTHMHGWFAKHCVNEYSLFLVCLRTISHEYFKTVYIEVSFLDFSFEMREHFKIFFYYMTQSKKRI